ncbi:MAG: type I-F CRISPR-associated endoribonuclease Cas6/Csy4 [Desulfovibrio sp.]|jgi:CRISPR-associated endonuclease Csy4|nr:type I-F CRISPR-associated endoribonuclease Cas6/Csy4 [Desulfovibrio sp.]
MDSYLDIRLRPSPAAAPAHLTATLFAKLHIVLTIRRCCDIGVSFPEFAEIPPGLGRCLRLHGTGEALDRLMTPPWLSGMDDYLSVAAIRATPVTSQYRNVSRVQAKSNPERSRRRQMRRHGLSREEAQRRIPDHALTLLNLPYVSLRSRSTGQQFRLFIRHGPLQTEPVSGVFNAYGLSATATIPWF